MQYLNKVTVSRCNYRPDFKFIEHQPHVADNSRLREPQREAYQATLAHFAVDRSPVLLQIPVGGGKTGLISTLPFGIANGRVLVVTPNVTIRESVYRAVNSASSGCFWSTTGVAKPSVTGPFAAILDGPSASMADCLQSHYVVANVQQVAHSGNRWLNQMDQAFFDMIILDEGHHNAANSWRRLLAHFPQAKVISLTATPFRSDGQEVLGKLIYRYSYKRAMLRGYIKTLKSIQVHPCEISFTFGDSNETASLEQILQLREEAWFSRGVALADQCNQHIVAASIQACDKLRKATGFKHQIIAAACSVEHAERLAILYRQSGREALEIHSKQAKSTQRFVLQQLRSGKIDTIIQVQMLGEGFDHPALSVAAIFRPFRSLSPYVQFVGRVMRVIRQGQPAHPDNHGFVISHVGMNTERHWEQFRDLDGDDQELWAELIRGQNRATAERLFVDELDHLPDDEKSKRIEMLVDWDHIGNTAVSTYATLDTSFANDQQEDALGDIQVNTVVGPQERRRQAHSRLKSEVESSVRCTLNRLKIHGLGKQISRIHPMLRSQNNWCATRYWIYYNLNRSIGRKPKVGKDWTLEEIESALERLPAILEQLVSQYQARYSRRYW